MHEPGSNSVVDLKRRRVSTEETPSFKVYIDNRHVDYLNIRLLMAREQGISLVAVAQVGGDTKARIEKYELCEHGSGDKQPIISERDTLAGALQEFHRIIKEKMQAHGTAKD